MMDTQAIQQLGDWLKASRSAVFFGGAGVSTESGIPDFRSQDGLYAQEWPWPPEQIVSHTFLTRMPEEFYRFYRQRMLAPDAKPNPAHLALARWEAEGKLTSVVTQNIDGLHQAAGSRRVWELHGSVHRNHCVRCCKAYPLQAILESEGVPRCGCGGMIRPDVVLYEEALDQRVLAGAMADIAGADLLIVGGTSLAVYPAAGLVERYRGRMVVINKTPTPQDTRADLVIAAPIGQVLAAVPV